MGAPVPVLVRDTEAGRDLLSGDRRLEADTTVEPYVAVNPRDSHNAVAVYQVGRIDGAGAGDNGFATTADGGRTWRSGLLPGLTKDVGGPFARASDPVVAFGPDGTVYANSLVVDDPDVAAPHSGLAVNVSRDGGRSWSAPVFLQADRGLVINDKDWIVVDQAHGPGHHSGRVYVVWDRIAPVLASYSDDHGRTWLPLFSVVYAGQGLGATPVVLANGDLAVVFSTEDAAAPVLGPRPTDVDAEPIAGSGIVVATARGAGRLPTGAPLVFGPPVSVSATDPEPVADQRVGPGLPAVGVDPRDGRMYVAWQDVRFRADGLNDIVMTRSDDGLRWTPPQRVDVGAPADRVNHWNPALAVDAAGRVAVSYRQRFESPAADRADTDVDTYVHTYVQVSSDGGATFGRPLRVDTRPTDLRFAALDGGRSFLGDYDGVALGGGFLYVARCEAFRLYARERATLPPSVHHQRTWVAVAVLRSGRG